MDEWIRTTADIDPNDYATGQLIVNNPRYQNVHCFGWEIRSFFSQYV